MGAVTYRNGRAIFEGALEQPAGMRAAYVAGACAGDRQLQIEVDAMLPADGEADGLPDVFGAVLFHRSVEYLSRRRRHEQRRRRPDDGNRFRVDVVVMRRLIPHVWIADGATLLLWGLAGAGDIQRVLAEHTVMSGTPSVWSG